MRELSEALAPQYQLEREIGHGGMATVYLAYDTKHQRKVALKVLNPDLAQSLGAHRFRREIATLAKLSHPHILSVHDSGNADDYLWFTMPFVEGESVRHRLERDKQLPIDEALTIARDVASALGYAHARGIIHRDIKPENVLLTEQGEALLADFGIAVPMMLSPRSTLTTDGWVVGTPQYMSPEQAAGVNKLDARSDVYMLGVLLYEMLAGVRPRRNESLSIRRVRPAVPLAVDIALRTALALVPDERWVSVTAFANALVGADTPTAKPRRWHVVVTVVLALGVATAGAAMLRRTAGRTQDHPAPAAIRLAVLPFINDGDSVDTYFADGVTDAVRAKLARVSGLEVIGSTSSAHYRHTTKPPREIARELGVQYLLEGTVQWAKAPVGGMSRVRVSTELVDARTEADKWVQPFDAPLTDVFQMQTDIAGRVAEQLQVALPDAAQTLAGRPTANLNAYDAYLRGVALGQSKGGSVDIERREVALFKEAVTLDSTFALAWAELAQAQGRAYSFGVPLPALADSADRASVRALTLAPGIAETHLARAGYWLRIHNDPARAYRDDSTALALGPPDAPTLVQTAIVEATLGRWDASEAHWAEAERLDPQSMLAAAGLGQVAALRHHNAQARSAMQRALALSPTNLNAINVSLLPSLGEGDLAGARAMLRSIPASVDRNSLVAFIAEYGDLGWVLDSSDAERLLHLGPDAFDGDRGAWAIALAHQEAWRGDLRRAREYARLALPEFEAQVQAAPNDAARRAALGVTLAYLGRRPEAIQEGERAVALLPITRDAYSGPYIQHQLVRIELLAGDTARALDALEPLLRTPYVLTPAWLRIDPCFASLRGNARFEQLASTRP